jgi:hypothetical protein
MRPFSSHVYSGITISRTSFHRSNRGRIKYIGGALLGSVFAFVLLGTALLAGATSASKGDAVNVVVGATRMFAQPGAAGEHDASSPPGRPAGSPLQMLEKRAVQVSHAPVGGSSTPTADATPLVTATATPFCSPRFTVVTSPNVSDATFNNLYGVSALAPDDVWAVGTSGGGSTFYNRTLVQHWDGTQWSIIPSPNPLESGGSVLEGVAAIAPDDVWAVGYTDFGSGTILLTMHWDGTQWSIVPGANAGENDTDALYSVTALAPDDVWAVGYFWNNFGETGTLIQHWNGTQWSVVPTPSVEPSISVLTGVSAVAPNDIWAVGYKFDSNKGGQTLIEHWNGSAWSIVPSPNPNTFDNELLEVAAIAANDVWAVGYYSINGSSMSATLIEHWDGTQWSIVSGPNPGYYNNALSGISALSSNDIWAVGSYAHDFDTPHQTLVEHWDGSQWTAIFSPGPGEMGNGLGGVAAVAKDDVWAVGTLRRSDQLSQTLIEHYSTVCGTPEPTFTPFPTYTPTDTALPTSTPTATPTVAVCAVDWRVVGHPDVGTLTDVEAIAPDDVYVTGSQGVLHWDGSAWSIVRAQPYVYYSSVAGLASDDVWVLGNSELAHWNGSTWTAYTGLATNANRAIAMGAPNRAWAVGGGNFSPGISIVYWNGTYWTPVSITAEAKAGRSLEGGGCEPEDILYDVVAVSATQAWAVGVHNVTYPCEQTYPIIVHCVEGTCSSSGILPTQANLGMGRAGPYDYWAVGSSSGASAVALYEGGEWVSKPAPDIGPLTGVEGSWWGDVWAVGAGGFLHYNGRAWARSPAPTGGAYKVAASGPGDAWAVRDTTILRYTPLQFSDVPIDNTFYPYVRCMACKGIITGYADGTFRPNNYVTRGQLSKIVANSAGFNEPVSGQTFEDVPPANTFYPYVERIASRNIIGGYPCGSASEPCGVGNKPYFRPNANATRAQISKITSNAAGFNDPASGQNFEDIPASHSFYVWIQRLASRGYIGGYPCGGFGYPCGYVDLPYFRPSNNATRGQLSKIVGNTFSPNCQAQVRR